MLRRDAMTIYLTKRLSTPAPETLLLSSSKKRGVVRQNPINSMHAALYTASVTIIDRYTNKHRNHRKHCRKALPHPPLPPIPSLPPHSESCRQTATAPPPRQNKVSPSYDPSLPPRLQRAALRTSGTTATASWEMPPSRKAPPARLKLSCSRWSPLL